MIIRNSDLLTLGTFLMDLKLKGTKSRMRTRFVKKIQEQLDLIQQEKEAIIRNYGVVDENGQIKTKIENGNEVYEIIDREQCEKELAELYSESLFIEENDGNKQMLLAVKDAVLNCDLEFNGQNALNYDMYCELFENLTYDKELAQ
jgi:hypothetical protein